jgi:hypothetical protein
MPIDMIGFDAVNMIGLQIIQQYQYILIIE